MLSATPTWDNCWPDETVLCVTDTVSLSHLTVLETQVLLDVDEEHLDAPAHRDVIRREDQVPQGGR